MKGYTTLKTMRWYGPNDPVSLIDLRQAGCEGVVTALHHVPVGEIWQKKDIEKRAETCANSGLKWSVVESLPVSDEIKRRSKNFKHHIENYKISLENLALNNIDVVTYNFMPVFDWLRTNVEYNLSNGAKALLFSKSHYTLFDLLILKRDFANGEYSTTQIKEAEQLKKNLDFFELERLKKTILLGLPGSTEAFTLKGIQKELKKYKGINHQILKENLRLFLNEIIPVAEKLGIKMAIHPDDPPWPIFGLPRVVSTQDDIRFILNSAPSIVNGLCFCTGSFGASKNNHLLNMIDEFQEQIHFLHLRNVKHLDDDSFYEADHLDGDIDMASIMKKIVSIMQTRKQRIPMRPDHGHQLLDDLEKKTYPGYSAIGRLKGLAELKGLELGLINTYNN